MSIIFRKFTAEIKTIPRIKILIFYLNLLFFSSLICLHADSLDLFAYATNVNKEYQILFAQYEKNILANSSIAIWQKNINSLQELIDKYPNHPQTPKALVKQANIYSLLAQSENRPDLEQKGAQILNKLVKQYPNQPETLQALLKNVEIGAQAQNSQTLLQRYNQIVELFPDYIKIAEIKSFILKINGQFKNNVPKIYATVLNELKANQETKLNSNANVNINECFVKSANQVEIGNQLRLIIEFNTLPKYEVVGNSIKELKLKIINCQWIKDAFAKTQLKPQIKIVEQNNDIVIDWVENVTKEFSLFPFSSDDTYKLVIDGELNVKNNDLEIANYLNNSAIENTSLPQIQVPIKKKNVVTIKNQTLNQVNSKLNAPEKNPKSAVASLVDKSYLSKAFGLKVRKIVIDPGHGGKDPGAIGHGLQEKDLTLIIAKQLKTKIITLMPQLKVVLTREDDRYISLDERTEFTSKAQADLFISIHINSFKDSSKKGIETYYLNYTNDSQALQLAAIENASYDKPLSKIDDLLKNLISQNKTKESLQLAKIIHENVFNSSKLAEYNIADKGIKQAPFIVLIGTKIPSILLELGFISNKNDSINFKNDDYISQLSQSLASGIEKFINWNNSGVNYANTTNEINDLKINSKQ